MFWGKPLVFALCLLPLAWLAWGWASGGLGANPIEATTRFLGDWTLRFLLLTLAVTPLRRLFGWNGVARLRRMLGLFAFAYGILHMASYLGLDLFFDWGAFVREVGKRTYMTLGMAALLLMLPLALTSTDAMIRRLGGRRWRLLHRLVYAIAILGVVHHWMMVKADFRLPLAHALVLAVLLASRLPRRHTGRQEDGS